MRKLLIILCAMFIGTAYACDTNQIDVLGDGTQCETAKFTITTTELEPDTEFKFYMSAQGTFYVDWGDGVVDTITRTNATETLYEHTYTSGGVKTIRMTGRATRYSAWCSYSSTCAAIRFGKPYPADNTRNASNKLVATIDGSLGAIFPTLGQSEKQQPLFPTTFQECTNLTSIPGNLFAGVTGSATYMFFQTFIGCKNLTHIPENLFSGISGSAVGMFLNTFWGVGITKIPENLFANIKTASTDMFTRTFRNCTNLSGYIPPSTFAGLIANGSPTATYMWNNTFLDTKLVKSCPAGTVQYMTGYEGVDSTNYTKWDGYVSCVDENLVCGAGEYLPAHWYQCEKCPENNYCVGGTYPYSETNSSGAIQCSTGLYSPAGMWESAQCGRILHIGDNVVYLRATKKTSPALHIDIDNDGVADFFGNMTTSDVVMNANTDKKLKLQYGGQTYSVYDDTVDLTEYESQ